VGERFEMVVEDMFHITGRGTVFTGVVRGGPVRVGDRVVIRSPAAQVFDRVRGVERERQILSEASPGEAVALLFTGFDPHRVADGLDRTPEGFWTVRSLRIEAAPLALGWPGWLGRWASRLWTRGRG
jgi:translation elongation factor EF-Tu-like GTPase